MVLRAYTKNPVTGVDEQVKDSQVPTKIIQLLLIFSFIYYYGDLIHIDISNK
jgi:hypothetical protein